MKKIILNLKPFLLSQEFIVTENGNRLDVVKGNMRDIPKIIFELCEKYDIKNINLLGAKKYAEGIKKDIEEKELTKYKKNKLEIKIL